MGTFRSAFGRIVAEFRDNPKGESLCLHRNDPIACFVHNKKLSSPTLFVLLIAFFTLPELLVAFFNKSFTSPTLGPDVSSDLTTAAYKLHRLWLAFTQAGQLPTSIYPTSSTNFVILRDYTYVICMLLAPVVLMRIFRQWDRLSSVPATLRENGCFRADLSTVEYRNVLSTFRSTARSPWLNVGALVIAVFMVALIYRQLSLQGLYPILNPLPVSESAASAPWNRAAFAGWWARPREGNLLSYVSFGVVVVDWTIIFYYALVVNVIGVLYIWTFWKIYRARGERQFFRIQPDDPDGWCGFGVVHDLEWDVIKLIGLYGVMIALGMCYVGLRGAPVYALFFVIWILFSQLYIWLPRGVFGTILRRHKEAQLKVLSQKIKLARASVLQANGQQCSPRPSTGSTAAVQPTEFAMVDSLYRTTQAMPTELLSVKIKLIVATIASVLPLGSALLNFAETHALGELLPALFKLFGAGG